MAAAIDSASATDPRTTTVRRNRRAASARCASAFDFAGQPPGSSGDRSTCSGSIRGLQASTQGAPRGEQMLATVRLGQAERVGDLGVRPLVEIVEQHALAL